MVLQQAPERLQRATAVTLLDGTPTEVVARIVGELAAALDRGLQFALGAIDHLGAQRGVAAQVVAFGARGIVAGRSASAGEQLGRLAGVAEAQLGEAGLVERREQERRLLALARRRRSGERRQRFAVVLEVAATLAFGVARGGDQVVIGGDCLAELAVVLGGRFEFALLLQAVAQPIPRLGGKAHAILLH